MSARSTGERDRDAARMADIMGHVMTYGRGMSFYTRYKLQKQYGAKKIEDIYQS
jgi:hypothetical protein